jgi:hypothetical protein
MNDSVVKVPATTKRAECGWTPPRARSRPRRRRPRVAEREELEDGAALQVERDGAAVAEHDRERVGRRLRQVAHVERTGRVGHAAPGHPRGDLRLRGGRVLEEAAQVGDRRLVLGPDAEELEQRLPRDRADRHHLGQVELLRQDARSAQPRRGAGDAGDAADRGEDLLGRRRLGNAAARRQLRQHDEVGGAAA